MPTLLTATAVAKLKPKARQYEVRDARSSLRLLVFPSGAKSWVMRFRRPDGRPAKLTLGPVNLIGETEGSPVIGGPLTLAAARKLAAEVDLARASGHDPAAERKRAKRAPVEHTHTFAACVERYVGEYASVRTRRWRVTARTLGVDLEIIPGSLADRWRDKPVREIGGNDIHAVVVEAAKRGVPGLKRLKEGTTDSMARHMHSVLSRFFSWLVAQRVIDVNPCVGVHRPGPGPSRERVLDDSEIRAFWSACGQLGYPFGSVFQFMLATGARRQECAEMMRDEIDGNVWTIPASRTKNKRTHKVPLSSLAREIIEGREGRYVFTFGQRPVAGFSVAKRRLDALMPGVASWRLHDLRRSAASLMARAGAELHVIERSLNHVSGSFGGIVGVYQKHRYEDAVERALEAYAALLRSIVSPTADNVVTLRGR